MLCLQQYQCFSCVKNCFQKFNSKFYLFFDFKGYYMLFEILQYSIKLVNFVIFAFLTMVTTSLFELIQCQTAALRNFSGFCDCFSIFFSSIVGFTIEAAIFLEVENNISKAVELFCIFRINLMGISFMLKLFSFQVFNMPANRNGFSNHI